MLNMGGQHPDGGSGVLREGRGSAPSPGAFLKKRIRAGSIHTQLNYDSQERATHQSEMPASALASRVAKVEMKAADATRWRKETSTYRVAEKRTLENFAMDPTEYTYNFRAEELPKNRPVLIDAFGTIKKVFFDSHFNRTVEMPVHSALKDKTAWNLSTQVPFAERVRIQEAKDAKHRAAAAKATLRITGSMGSSSSSSSGGGGGGGGGEAYVGLKAREDRRCAETRAAKAAEAEAAAPFLTDEARAATLRWAANFKDSVSRLDPISPGGSLATTSVISSTFGESLPLPQSGGTGGKRKAATNLEKRYVSIVRDEIQGLRTASALDAGKHKSTRWCLGSI